MPNDVNELFNELISNMQALAREVDQLRRQETGITLSNDNVSNPPTAAELTTAFGAFTDLPDPFLGIVDDAGAGTTVWLVVAVNSTWHYEGLTLAV